MINARCSLCLCGNRITVNIYNTNLQQLYQTLADYKIKDECWMCYICHRRLQQCYRLQQLAVQTRGIIDDVCERKNVLAPLGSVLDLTVSKTRNTSTPHPQPTSDIKREPELKSEPSNDVGIERKVIEECSNTDKEESPIELDSSQLVRDDGCTPDVPDQDDTNNGNLFTTSQTKNITTAHPCIDQIKEETDLKTETSCDDGDSQIMTIDIHENSYEFEENGHLTIHFETHTTVSDAGRNESLLKIYRPKSEDKIKDECWMCYICHKRLQQCYRLQQLALQTRGIVDDVCKRKNVLAPLGSVLDLTVSKTRNTSTPHPTPTSDIKREPELKSEPSSDVGIEREVIEECSNTDKEVSPIGLDSSQLVRDDGCTGRLLPDQDDTHNGHLFTASQTKNITTAHPCIDQIKEEIDLKTEPFCEDGDSQTMTIDIHENSYEFEENGHLTIHFETHTTVSDGGRNGNLLKIYRPKSEDKVSQCAVDESVQQTYTVSDESIKIEAEPSAGRSAEQSTENSCVEQKIQAKIGGTGIKQDVEEGNTNDHSSEVQPGCHKKPFTCDVCWKTFSSQRVLLEHGRSHRGKKAYTCDICNKSYTRTGSLNKHKKIHTGEKPFTCDICEKRFAYKTILKEHLRSHTGERPFSCDVCDKRFSRAYYLREHMRTHDKVYDFSCHVCAKRFSHKSYLRMHIRKHSDSQPFSCPDCSRKFVFKSSLDTHMKVHSSEKPFACDACPLRFKTKSALKLHCRTHGGDKRFCCEFCSWMFFTKTDLIEHTRSHTGEKPHRCDVCKKGFARKNNLRLHLRTHTGEKPYSCELCLKRFNVKCNFKKHKCVKREPVST